MPSSTEGDMEERENLEAEIKRLREALEKIATWADEAESGWYPGDIARKALDA